MHYLTSIEMCPSRELENELKHFFNRLHHIKHRLLQEKSTLLLNRIQRKRCCQNIVDMGRLEKDFYAIEHKDDIQHLYQKVHRYVKLDHESLMDMFGKETLSCSSLFIAL